MTNSYHVRLTTYRWFRARNQVAMELQRAHPNRNLVNRSLILLNHSRNLAVLCLQSRSSVCLWSRNEKQLKGN